MLKSLGINFRQWHQLLLPGIWFHINHSYIHLFFHHIYLFLIHCVSGGGVVVKFKQIPIREVYVAGQQHCPYLVLPIKLAANDLWLNCLAFGRFMNSMNHFLHWISQWLIGVFRHPKGMVLASAGGMVAPGDAARNFADFAATRIFLQLVLRAKWKLTGIK